MKLRQTWKLEHSETIDFIFCCRVGFMRHGHLLAEDSPDLLLKTHSAFSLEQVFLNLCQVELEFFKCSCSYINTGRRLQSYFGDNQSSRRRTEESQVLRKKSSTTTLKFSELCISAPRKRERTLIINLQHPRFPTLAHFSSRTGSPWNEARLYLLPEV